MLAGRGGGKTRSAAEWVIEEARDNPGIRIALIARTAGDVRSTMLEGPSGILSIAPPDFMPEHESSKCKLIFPNGTIALHFSADAPAGLRGPQFHRAWGDEIATWPTLKDEDDQPGIPTAWAQLQYGMRLPGVAPQVVLSTTPKRIKLITDLIKDPACEMTRWSTFANAANLAPEFVARMRSKFEGTRVGRQELYAELLEDVEGALWQWKMFDRLGARLTAEPDELARVVVAVDPSGGSGKDNDEQGIVVAGRLPGPDKDVRCAVLADLSCKLSPDGWGRRAVQAYLDHEADRIVYETNYGGEMVEAVIQNAARELGAGRVPTRGVTAMRGKQLRAEPVSSLYEQNRCPHVGIFPELETEQCSWVPNTGQKSPNRLDALVYAITDLALGGATPGFRRRQQPARRV